MYILEANVQLIFTLSTHTHIMPTQDGVTADEVAEVHGHQEVCEELRKPMHGGHRPLSKVSPVL